MAQLYSSSSFYPPGLGFDLTHLAAQLDRWSGGLPVDEGLQQCAVVLVQQQQVGGQTEVATQRFPLARSSTCNRQFQVKLLQVEVCSVQVFSPSRSAGGDAEFM